MKEDLNDLIRKSRGRVPKAEVPNVPDGFGARVAASHAEASKRERAEQIRWVRAGAAGAAVALVVAVSVHVGVDRDGAVSAANSWLELSENSQGVEP